MTHHTRHLTRALMIAALAAGAWTATEAAQHHAAHADTRPGIVAEQGGQLGHDLPAQASDQARDTLNQAPTGRDEPTAQPTTSPSPLAKPEPTAEPEPEPTQEPTPVEEPTPADEPTTGPRTTNPTPAPATDPIVDVPPAGVPPVVVDTPPVVIDTPPVVIDPAPSTEPAPAPVDAPVTLPSTDTAPLPDATEPVVQPRPLPVPVPAPPVQLPVLIAPLAADTTEPAAVVGEQPGTTIEQADSDPCAEHLRRTIRVDLIGQLIDSLTAPTTTPQPKAKPGCPRPGDPAPHVDCMPGTATSSSTSSTCLYADVTGGLPAPALTRIEHARARSAIPASRHVAIEPGPA